MINVGIAQFAPAKARVNEQHQPADKSAHPWPTWNQRPVHGIVRDDKQPYRQPAEEQKKDGDKRRSGRANLKKSYRVNMKREPTAKNQRDQPKPNRTLPRFGLGKAHKRCGLWIKKGHIISLISLRRKGKAATGLPLSHVRFCD